MTVKATLKDRILDLLKTRPGLTDREITDILQGPHAGQQAVNQATRQLATSGRIVRQRRRDGLFRNYLPGTEPAELIEDVAAQPGDSTLLAEDVMSEDEVKRALEAWLTADGWQVTVRFGHDRGIDVDARRDKSRWIIEAKGAGKYDPMRVNYFLGALGELLRRMDDPDARYSIALPDLAQYRRLWDRLPGLAKQRMRLSALFVDRAGQVEESVK